MRTQGVFRQRLQHAAQVNGDVVPGWHLIGHLGMRAIPVGRDIGVRPGHGQKRRRRQTGADNGIGARKVQIGRRGIVGQVKGNMCGEWTIRAIDHKGAKAPDAGEGKVLVGGRLAEYGVGVQGGQPDW